MASDALAAMSISSAWPSSRHLNLHAAKLLRNHLIDAAGTGTPVFPHQIPTTGLAWITLHLLRVNKSAGKSSSPVTDPRFVVEPRYSLPVSRLHGNDLVGV